MEEKLLYKSNEKIDIIQVCSILEENNIPFVKREDGAGQYLNIGMGVSNIEQSIYVSEENFDISKQLIQSLISEDKSDYELDSFDIKETNKAKLYRKIIGWTCLIIPTILIIIAIIIMNLKNNV